MHMKMLLLVSAFAGLCVGCSTPSQPQVWAGAPPEIREGLGTVGVRVAYAESRDFVADMPDGKRTAAGEGVGFGVAANLVAAAYADKAAPVVLALMPAFALGGAVYGSVAGVSAPEFQRSLTAITNSLRECDLVVHLPEQIVEQARAREFDVVDARGRDAVCDTRLTVRVVTQQLSRGGIETPDPALFLQYVVEARVTDANGNMLYSTYVETTSRRRDFTEWAENDARRLRRESQRMAREISNKIVGRVFSGVASE
jgi:hypothetical protein